MNKHISILFIISLLALVGCTIPNPLHHPGDNNPPFLADTASISNAVTKLQEANQALGPLNPYSSLSGIGISVAGGIATGLSLLVAGIKNSKANKANEASQIMAQGVIKANAQSTVLDVASNTPHFAVIANHLNEATPS